MSNPTDLDSKALVKDWLDACYSDRPADGFWMIADHHVEYLSDRLQAIIARECDKVRIQELENLRHETREITTPNAHVTDTGVAQSIRLHTNALIEYRLAQLKAEAAQKGEDRA